MTRKNLNETLSASVARHALTIVVAPTGYGKSIAARALADTMGAAAFLFDVPREPHDKYWLWEAFCTQLETQRPFLAAKIRELGFPGALPLVRAFLEEAAFDARPAVFILDDCQHFSPGGMDWFFESAVKYFPPSLRLATFSRTRPDMKIEEKSTRGRIATLGEEVLRFTKTEARWYFELHGITDAEAAARAWEISEGWPAALRLSLEGWLNTRDVQRTPDLEALLAKSVLAGLSEADHSLLMQLSVMDTFCAEDAKALGGKAASRNVQAFRDANAILVHDAAAGRYRFHRLVRGYLTRRLAATPDMNRPALYRRAAECQMNRGELLPAFHLLLRAGKDDDLIRALDLFLMPGAESMFASGPEKIQAAVQALSWRIRARHPLGYLAFIRLYLLAGGESSVVSWWLVEAEANFFAEGSSIRSSREHHNRIKGEMAVVSGLLAFNDMDALWKNHDHALSLLRGPSTIHPRLLPWWFGCPHLSFAGLRDAGKFEALVNGAAGAEATLTALTEGSGSGCAEILRMERHLERGELDELEHCLDSFERNRPAPARPGSAIPSRFLRARLLLARGGTEAAVEALEDLRPQVTDTGTPGHAQALNLALDYVNACIGRVERVSEQIRDGEVFSSLRAAIQSRPLLLVVYGKTLMALGEYERLEAMARNMPLRFMEHKSVFGRIHAKIFEAVCLQRLQGTKIALEALRAATELARPDGIVFPFAEYGSFLTPLLRGLDRECGDDSHVKRIRTFAESIRRHYLGDVPRGGASLTFREEEIMRLMIKGMTNAGIGKELGITGDAVKKALAVVYGKLGASNRIQASRLFASRHK